MGRQVVLADGRRRHALARSRPAARARDRQPADRRRRRWPMPRRKPRRSPRRFAALAAETDGLLDFKRDRDALINQDGHPRRAPRAAALRQLRHHPLRRARRVRCQSVRGRARWLLTDGRLTARAIRNTLRWRDTQPWLVYANACEAGMDADRTPTMYQNDVFGLASAFLDHGVSVFVGPLWRNRRPHRRAHREDVLRAAAERAADRRRGAADAKVEAKAGHVRQLTCGRRPRSSARIASRTSRGPASCSTATPPRRSASGSAHRRRPSLASARGRRDED